ncbi:dihydrodipicolinate synthase family protein [Falsibacillus pallidus]|uniref:Dihydrodipicolinate synthase/N-acetylneuraminate lyase n=1 Tax=Falsibacillus pallidus TaxID=493781 RepID=A0A370GAE7_9BACI|nr:dihydrodipicolinate synthase family protein [Falsibacillus pallidus]RDI40009.1 dihydrodipicolinate synthase/N-acetylneuraminate lyase [Falsibacillus pallidus]
MLSENVKKLLFSGTVIPAHPLALNENRELDEARQRALTQYYMDAGAGGVAVGVHTTQFEIRDPKFHLYEKVLNLAIEEIEKRNLQRPFIKVAGIAGPTQQAVKETHFAKNAGYDLGLLSMGGLNDYSEAELLNRTKRIAEIIPVFGFYLQPSVGGRVLSFEFWKTFAEIDNVFAIKMAPFNRYQTLDVVRAVCESTRSDQIALYTGNDDNIINDLLTVYRFQSNGKTIEKAIVGGLLGHWAVWTKTAVEYFERIKAVRGQEAIPAHFLTLAQEVTDANAAFFDSANRFKGCIAGINKVLAMQGLLQGEWCLLPEERLSDGQLEEIQRVYRDYPHLQDDSFVSQNLSNWLNKNEKQSI